ncbi:MAG TPA: TIGR03435 family protein [Vicinamibacterales bacterium]|nr:TIGR03435 family protein [Vicinamibacterales bacterium]
MRNLMILAGVAMAIAFAVLTAPRPLAQSFTAPAGTVPAPDPNIPLYFEAASIRPANPDAQGQGIRRQPGGRFNTINAPIRMLITFAYQLQNFQLVGGPDWVANERYDIVAKMEGDPPPIVPGSGADHMMLAMRSLLADRFKLVIRRETRQLDIYALTMAKAGGKPGPALKPASEDCSPAALAARRGGPPPTPGTSPVVCGMQQGPGRIRFGSFPLSLFASGISNRVGRMVIDRTGLSGNWDFELTFAAEPLNGPLPPGAVAPPVDPDAPNLFTAIQEQLGLKLESTKGPVEVLVIESIQHPTPD